MVSYYRIMLGRKSVFFQEAFDGQYVGAGWLEDLDLTDKFPENWRDFNKQYIPIYQKKNPDKTKVAAGLACGMLWTIARGILVGDIVLCPDGQGSYLVGQVKGGYCYVPGSNLPHQRPVRWHDQKIRRDQMSQILLNSLGAIGTLSNVTRHSAEIASLIGDSQPAGITTTDETIEDPSTFALEKHLEDFLVQNWKQTELGKTYDIFETDGELIGQQYPSDTGPIDILAISKNKKELLVVELKKGRVSDVVVGQVQRYMGYVKDELAEKNQIVRGAIIAFEDDIRLSRALSVAPNIDFYTYKVSFKLEKKSEHKIIK